MALKSILTRAAACVAVLALAGGAVAQNGLQTAVFAGGCFWTMEHGLEDIPGVVKAVSGYTGGREPHPTYEQVSSETTGHVEAVQVVYDPKKISYRQLVDKYWRLTDPTDLGGQACDRGPSYQPGVFVTPDQRATAEASKAANARFVKGGRILTPIRNASAFWPAEGYHQQFTKKNPARYAAYRVGCGRDRLLKTIWTN